MVAGAYKAHAILTTGTLYILYQQIKIQSDFLRDFMLGGGKCCLLRTLFSCENYGAVE